jgi:hypothetical protein
VQTKKMAQTTKTAKPKAKTVRKTANPRRTTLAHAEALSTPEARVHAVELPQVTANPRRTILMTAPEAAAPEAASQS